MFLGDLFYLDHFKIGAIFLVPVILLLLPGLLVLIFWSLDANMNKIQGLFLRFPVFVLDDLLVAPDLALLPDLLKLLDLDLSLEQRENVYHFIGLKVFL